MTRHAGVNYRHAFHAGNFADVFKHVLLVRMLVYLGRKDAPFRYIDTHAGPGLYDFAAAEAARSQEWRGGIGRIRDDDLPAPVRPLIGPYLDALGARDSEGRPALYPGSPVVAQRVLRPQDRLLLNEIDPEEADALRRAIGRDRRAKVVALDGYIALKAFVPPKERRGLVLVDPPFERADEFARMERGLAQAHGKWATGVYVLWYPIKDPGVAHAFAAGLAGLGIDRLLRLELLIEDRARQGIHDRLALIGCGLIVVNAPFTLEHEASILLPYLASRLSHDGRGSFRVERLKGAPAGSDPSGAKAGPAMKGLARK